MNIKQKIKSALGKFTAKSKTARSDDSELAADEVIEKEVYPRKTKTSAATKTRTKTTAASCKNSAQKKASKRTRPTNDNYTMIDPDGDTADTSKS